LQHYDIIKVKIFDLGIYCAFASYTLIVCRGFPYTHGRSGSSNYLFYQNLTYAVSQIMIIMFSLTGINEYRNKCKKKDNKEEKNENKKLKEEDNGDEVVIQKEILEFVSDTVKKIDLDEPDKNYLEIFVLRYDKGLTQNEISEALGISQSEVSKRLYKLMDKVKTILK
jgi:RNA polymerase sigma factor (sigma-70 family)